MDSDVIFKFINNGPQLREVLESFYEENVLATNQPLFEYTKGSQNEVFHLHDKYIEHFNLNYDEKTLMSLDGPVLVYMGKTNEDLTWLL